MPKHWIKNSWHLSNTLQVSDECTWWIRTIAFLTFNSCIFSQTLPHSFSIFSPGEFEPLAAHTGEGYMQLM